jgi:hypothetical protein
MNNTPDPVLAANGGIALWSPSPPLPEGNPLRKVSKERLFGTACWSRTQRFRDSFGVPEIE